MPAINNALKYVSIQHEIGMAIGKALRLRPMLGAFSRVCLRRLGLSAVHFHFLRSEHGELVLSGNRADSTLEHFYSIPQNSPVPQPPKFPAQEGAALCTYWTYEEADTTQHCYAFNLEGFGVLTLQRIDSAFDASIVELLKPLVVRLGLSCHASIEHENLLQVVAARDKAEKTILFQLLHDDLTQLPNRRSLMDQLGQQLRLAAEAQTLGALLFLDLDRFKVVNDTLGHAVGDCLLIAVAARLREVIGKNGCVFRLSGDEFVILLGNLGAQTAGAREHVDQLLQRIRVAFSDFTPAGEHQLHVTPSIGIELFPDEECTAEQILRRADSAMYQAKLHGLNSAVFYDRKLSFELERRRDIEKELQLALKAQNQFELHYQTQHALGGACIGAEALLRWHNPFRDGIGPGEFIAIAEEAGLMLELGTWVFRQACRDLCEMTRQGIAPGFRRLAVNVSGVQFNHRHFVETLTAIIEETGVDPHLLSIELTESTLITNSEVAIGKMAALRVLGIKVAIDDFGTGFSSLSYLSRLPAQSIKIDQSFVRNIDSDGGNRAIVETIVALGHALDIDLIAEGVETEAERVTLERLGCLTYQGFLFSHPVPLGELTAALARP